MKPAWLNKKIDLKSCSRVKEALRSLRLNTVCEQAMCPNIGECFGRGEATFLILGRNCTRLCGFCNIEKKKPDEVDLNEPERVAKAVGLFGLKHAVITSVTRDDLADGGAGAFARTVAAIKKNSPSTTVELLVPDFKLSLSALDAVIESGPDIIAHNIETVPALYPQVRKGADYARSLALLRMIKKNPSGIKTKSGLMLGLGEKREEVIRAMEDLRLVGCDFLCIGQYLAPSSAHYPVKEYIPPDIFDYFRQKGRNLGFMHIESRPYARSSYKAGEYISN